MYLHPHPRPHLCLGGVRGVYMYVCMGMAMYMHCLAIILYGDNNLIYR